MYFLRHFLYNACTFGCVGVSYIYRVLMVILYNKGTHPTLNWFETGLTPQDHVGIHGCNFVLAMNRETLFLFQERLFFIDATLTDRWGN